MSLALNILLWSFCTFCFISYSNKLKITDVESNSLWSSAFGAVLAIWFVWIIYSIFSAGSLLLKDTKIK
jgi:uncharacterized membrane protein (DUF373 family)